MVDGRLYAIDMRLANLPATEGKYTDMGIFDKAKDLVNEHNDKVDQGIDKAAEIIDEKTGGQHTEQIHHGAQQAKDAMDDVSGHERG